MHTVSSAPKPLEITYDSSHAEQQQQGSHLGIIPTPVLQLLLNRVSSYPPSLAACARTCRKFYHFAMPLVRQVPRSTLNQETSRILQAASTKNDTVWQAIDHVKKRPFVSSSESPTMQPLPLIALIQAVSSQAHRASLYLATGVTQCTYSFLPTPEFRKDFCKLLIQQSLQQLQLKRLEKVAKDSLYLKALEEKNQFLQLTASLQQSLDKMPAEQQHSRLREYSIRLHWLLEFPSRCLPELQAEASDLVEEFEVAPANSAKLEATIKHMRASCATIRLRNEYSMRGCSWRSSSLSMRQLRLTEGAASVDTITRSLEAIAKKLQLIQDNLQAEPVNEKPLLEDLRVFEELKALLKHSLRQLAKHNGPEDCQNEILYCRWLLEFRKTLEDQSKLLHGLKNHSLFLAADKAVFTYLRFIQMQVAPTAEALKEETALLQRAKDSLELLQNQISLFKNEHIESFLPSYTSILQSFIQTYSSNTLRKIALRQQAIEE